MANISDFWGRVYVEYPKGTENIKDKVKSLFKEWTKKDSEAYYNFGFDETLDRYDDNTYSMGFSGNGRWSGESLFDWTFGCCGTGYYEYLEENKEMWAKHAVNGMTIRFEYNDIEIGCGWATLNCSRTLRWNAETNEWECIDDYFEDYNELLDPSFIEAYMEVAGYDTRLETYESVFGEVDEEDEEQLEQFKQATGMTYKEAMKEYKEK